MEIKDEKTAPKRKLSPSIVLGGLVAVVLIVYFFTFTVRFDEICVVTTFDKANDETAVVTKPGLKLKWPYPIQDVQPYSKRVHTQQAVLEELMTKDGKALVIRSFVSWRVRDPLALFRTLRHIGEVKSQLNSRLRDAQTILGQYAFEDLVTPVPDKSKLTEVEGLIQAKLVKDMRNPQDYGIEIVTVGIHRVELHKQVTPAVFDHMRKVRESLAQTARSEGSAKAQAIKSSAERDRDIIMAFANRYAGNIRAEAIKNTTEIYSRFQKDEDFAIYLNELETLKRTLQKKTTFIMDTQRSPLDLFNQEKDEKKQPEQKK